MTAPSPLLISLPQFPDGFQSVDLIVTGYKRNLILVSALKTCIVDILEKTCGLPRERIVTSLL